MPAYKIMYNFLSSIIQQKVFVFVNFAYSNKKVKFKDTHV